MAERLTESEVSKSFTKQELRTSEQARIYQKLGQIEDIMEKYDIESFELLEHIIKKGIVINSTIEDFAKEEYDKMKQDRYTWQKACELACEKIGIVKVITDDDMADNSDNLPDYFYQQVKKEDEHNE